MQLTTVLGSPRKKGNTARVLEMFESLMTQRGYEVDRINIVDCEVNGCLGCQACKQVKHEPGCKQQDDAVGIFERMMAADAVIYATPLYTYGFPSQMKALVDRQNCLVTGYGGPEYTPLLRGKRIALLVTCGGPVEENADLIQEAFERESQYQAWDVVGKYVVPFCSTPDALGDKAMETAEQMARDILGG